MGSFNMKCALTQLPVTAGDEVVLLLGIKPSQAERKRDFTGGFDHQMHYFKLITTPLYGRYNSYGWIEYVEDNTLSAAAAFLNAMGYTEAVEAGLLGEHWDDCLSHMTKAVRRVEPDSEEVEVTYTFVHRSAWNNLLEMAKQRTMRIMTPLRITEQAGQELVDAMTAAGGIDMKYTYEHESAWLEGRMLRPQLFDQALRHLPAYLTSFTSPVLPENFSSLSKDEKAEALKRHHSAQVRLAANMDDSPLLFFTGCLQWLRPLFNKSSMVTPTAVQTHRLAALMTTLEGNDDLQNMLRDTDAMLFGLMQNQMALRAATDLPTQAQSSPYWGHVAVNRAVTAILAKEAEDFADNYEIPEGVDNLVDAMVQVQLADPY